MTQEDLGEIAVGEKFTFASETLSEERPFWISLPASYNESTHTALGYPVLYLLDGDAHFHPTSGVVRHISTGWNGNFQLPELIIVAILNTDRTRDLTPTHTKLSLDGKESEFLKSSGGAGKFLEFLREELFPEIESAYRTQPHRILVGHSLGGLVALGALLDTPDMFQSYIAMNPSLWWDNQVLVRRAKNEFHTAQKRRGSVYISLAHHPDSSFIDTGKIDEATRTFAEYLHSAASPGFRSMLEYFEAKDHSSVSLLSLYHGLLFNFEGYKPSSEDFLEQPAAVRAHFERISDRLGVVLLPPEVLVIQLGYTLLYETKDVDGAIELFKLNVSNYPESCHVWDSLGEAYLVKGDKPKAIEHYEKSLKLKPDNEIEKQQLETLRSEQESQ